MRHGQAALLLVVRLLILLSCGPLLLPPVCCACHPGEVAYEHDSVPAGDSDHHAPGCPALTCANRAPAIVTVSLIANPAAVSDISHILPVNAAEKHFSASQCTRVYPSDPPLFVSHCALVR